MIRMFSLLLTLFDVGLRAWSAKPGQPNAHGTGVSCEFKNLT